MIGIIGAMDSEIKILKANIKDLNIEKISDIDYYVGKINGNDIVVAKSGIGKVFASVCSEAMILRFKPNIVFHIGIAGALSNELGIKDVAIAESVVQYDIDQTSFNYPLGFIQGPDIINIPCDRDTILKIESIARKLNVKYKTGVIASGDKFISNDCEKDNIVKEFGAIAVDMESAATGQVCYTNGVRFAIIRAMSDSGGDDAVDSYNKSKLQSSDIATSIILEYLYLK